MNILKDGKDITEEMINYINQVSKEWNQDNEELFQKCIVSLFIAREYLSKIDPPMVDAMNNIENLLEKLTESK